ncbi:MAG: molybdopterin-synthase adenylyltransferase MoeB [Chloroflexi bacterium]|nr:molybdopterin-synthase adenylyltransferase MoeB [Chloroflexota bacterium]
MPQIRIPSPLRSFTNEQSQVEVHAETVGTALAELTRCYPLLRDHLFQDDELRNFVNLFIGEEDVNFLQGLDTPLAESDVLRILPSIAGGSLSALAPRGGEPLTRQEIARYSRHLILPEVGMTGQESLKHSSVLLVGAGGLGSPLALYLAAAGVGRIGIVDFDVVDESNLQRQVIHGQSDIGSAKLESARRRIAEINPNVQVDAYETPFTSENALEIGAPYDLIIDGTDNFPTRYLVNDVCVKLAKPNVYGSIFRFEGQLSVFYAQEGPCYRCLFPEPPPPGLVPSCAEGGVLGVLPGTIGTMQATEAIKLLLGIGQPLIGKMLLYDALEMSWTSIKIRKDPNCPVCSIPAAEVTLIDYEQFCGVPAFEDSAFSVAQASNGRTIPIRSISVRALYERQQSGEDIVVLDVRDPHEWQIAALDGTLRIPKGEIQLATQAIINGQAQSSDTLLAQIPQDRDVVVHCRSGIRSADVIAMLGEAGYDFDRLFNLAGGILAWADEVDPTLAKY